MSRRFITELGERETLDQTFLAADKQLRANRQGNLYLQVRLSDRTGSLTAMLWNAQEHVYGSFENGDYVRVVGTTQFYNNAMQMIMNRIERANPRDIDESEFITLSTADVDQLAAQLADMLRSMSNPHLLTLAECFLIDESFMSKFTAAPAGVKNHHAYRGGLLEHVVSLMRVTRAVAPLYRDLDDDLLSMGAFLHDVGKIEELSYERDLGYTDEGQLIGHLVMGVSLLEDKIRAAEKLSRESFPPELAMRLKHMIVSHHGEYEFGSPKLPMTLEAIALHYLDNLDAKIHSVSQLIETDSNADSNWTPFQSMLGRKLFKPGVKPDE
jgi:3'-5' exoribonuclease